MVAPIGVDYHVLSMQVMQVEVTRETAMATNDLTTPCSAKTPYGLISLEFRVPWSHVTGMKTLLVIVAVQSLNLVVFAWLTWTAWIRILALRQQLAVYKRKAKKPCCRETFPATQLTGVDAGSLAWRSIRKWREGLGGEGCCCLIFSATVI
jgi:hypothetical protein